MLLCGDMATKFASPVLMAKSTELSKRNKRRSIRMFKCRAAGADGGRVAVGDDVFSVTTSSKYEVDYLGQSTKGDLNLKLDPLHSFGNGQATLEGPIEEVARTEAQAAENLIRELGIQGPFSAQHSPRGIFCSRTLNLRSISAIGYDMDYTLMHYNVMAWEGRAYDYCMENLKNMGFPVDGLSFDPELVIRGLMIDKEKGNLVKADRFGYVKRAMHGTKMLSNKAVSDIYGRELVDLRNQSRWEFLNTFFSVSEALAYAQMVDRLDDGSISADLGILDYRGLYKAVAKALFRAHVEGQLKSEIMSKPELFVEPDPELPLALLDQKEAGKKLLLITNSDYHYTDKMMKHSFNKFLPNDMDWRDLFDMVIVSARKPEFFQMSHPLYEVVTGEGLMRPCFKAETGGLYSGGSAQMVENSLNVHGDEILYVGDHIYTDVSVSKVHLRWRTALICRELEEEYMALIGSRGHREELIELINQKEVVGDLFNQLRLALQRRSKGRPAQTLAATNLADQELTETMQKLLIVMQRLDDKIGLKEYKKEAKELSALFKGQEIQAHEGAILAMKFSPDGRYLASAGEDKVLRVWSVVEDERCEEHDVPKMDPSCIYFEVSNLSELRPVAVEKDGVNGGSLMSPRKTTESACVIIPPKIFRVVDKPVHEFLGHSGDILDVSWSKNNRLLSASADSSVRLWQIGCEDCLGIYSHSNYVTSVQFNPVDDDHFITGSIDGKVRIWSASRYQVVDWVDARSIVTAVCYRPDGQGVIIGTLTSECRFYNVTGHCLQLDGHICLHNKKKSSNKRIISFQFDSTDPSRVMVASADSQVRIISGRNVVHKYKGSRNAGNQISASFTGDGKHIISACDDSSVYVWNCVPHDPEPPSPGFFSHTKRIKIRSFEKFSADVSVAIPWCGFSSPGISGGSELSPSLFSLGREYVLDSPKGAATWPEEKLASSFSPVRAIRRSHYRFLRSSCRRTAESSHLWGLVIVTGGWDGRIRLFHNYGLPVPV